MKNFFILKQKFLKVNFGNKTFEKNNKNNRIFFKNNYEQTSNKQKRLQKKF
jgi:hypothetical protein